MAKDRVSVNLADPKDIRAKMPELKRLLVGARQELEALQEQVEMLTRIVGEPAISEQVVVPDAGSERADNGKAPKRQRQLKAAPAQERAVQALEKAGSPMGPAALFKFMEANGLDRPSNVTALNAVLWAAAKTGRVVKAANSTYAPAGGFPTYRAGVGHQDLAASNGQMPVPAQLPGPNGAGSPTAVLQTSPHAQTLSDGGGRPRESEEEKAAPS